MDITIAPAEEATVHEHYDYIMELVLPAVEENVPLARPSPYAKRWWTEELTTLRKDYTYWRNRARAERRAGSMPRETQQMAD